MNITSVLSVSQKEKLDCEKLAEFLGAAGILVDVTSNISMLPEKEYGCRIVQGVHMKEEIQRTWNVLKEKYKFQCAHISVGDKFKGCILDFLQPTKCVNYPNDLNNLDNINEFQIKSYPCNK